MTSVAILVNSLSGGGAERSMNLLSSELTKLGFKVSLIAINEGPADLVNPRCEVVELNRPRRGSPRTIFRARQQLGKQIKRIRPDVIIVNCELPELLISTLKFPGKLIVVEHTSLPWRGRRLIGFFVRSLLSIRCNVWVRVSPKITMWPKKLEEVFSIPNPLTPIALHGFGNQIGFSEVTRLIYIGRLSPEKRPGWALTVAALTGLPITFIGDGEMLKELKLLSSENGAFAEFVGHQRQPWSMVGPNDVVIVPSQIEGDGLVVLEALSLNLALLLADNNDLRKFGLGDGNYFETPESVSRLLVNNFVDLKVEKKIRENVLGPRSLDVIGMEWKSLLESQLKVPLVGLDH